jgi:hypothetical protein
LSREFFEKNLLFLCAMGFYRAVFDDRSMIPFWRKH